MRKAIIVALACALSASFANAQMKVKPQAPQGKSPFEIAGSRRANAAQFPRISQEDALKLYKEGKAVFVDVRSHEQFTKAHIKDALSIPGSQIVGRLKEIPLQKTIITYCACSAEQSSGHATAELIGHGVKNVFALKGGWNEWAASKKPTASGDK